MPSPTDTDLSPLLVVAGDDPLAPPIAAQLAALFPGRELTRFPDLEAAVSVGGDSEIIVPVTHPVEAIARHLSARGSVEGALTDWKSAAEPLLRAARRVRRRLRLVDARGLASAEAQVLAQLAEAGEPAIVKDLPPPLDPVLLVIAEAALLRDPEASRLADEIAALRRGGDGGGLSVVGCQAALQVHRQAKVEADRLQEAVAALEEKANLLDAEVSLLRESLALRLGTDRIAGDDAGQKRLAALPAGLRSLHDTLADLKLQTAKVQALQHQLDTATEQAAGREATLAAILLKDQQVILAGTESKARADQLERELHSVYASRSWRVTGPFRALRATG
ncbi:MAG: hypothetical protein Q7J44_15710 [Pseudotabrizicola sp.]|uniref:hypothetical protein n=1 Tax=Pseudotabrizicola sp. TaxID=2939647 RepID=UPI00271F193B|nr:hypothetical protein [Pseudotabrizicola sp.]MDO9639983.1 hypothetical protein [Pseudotabrizicola sp.]